MPEFQETAKYDVGQHEKYSPRSEWAAELKLLSDDPKVLRVYVLDAGEDFKVERQKILAAAQRESIAVVVYKHRSEKVESASRLYIGRQEAKG